jgi:hypothetical protein
MSGVLFRLLSENRASSASAAALSFGALVTLAIGSRTGTIGVPAGIRIGSSVGFLLWFTADFMLFGIGHHGISARPSW